MDNAVPASRFSHHWKKVAFGLVAVITLYDIYMDEGFVLHPHSPDWEYYYGFRHMLIPHVICACATIMLGPAQFSRRLRRRHLRLHRILGRIYVAAIFVAAPLAIFMERSKEKTNILFATYTQSLLWMITAAMAYLSARRGRITQHREWMVRSYCVTCIFVVGKALLHVPWLVLVRGLTLPSFMFTMQLLAILIPDLVFDFSEPAALRGLVRRPAQAAPGTREIEPRAVAGPTRGSP